MLLFYGLKLKTILTKPENRSAKFWFQKRGMDKRTVILKHLQNKTLESN